LVTQKLDRCRLSARIQLSAQGDAVGPAGKGSLGMLPDVTLALTGRRRPHAVNPRSLVLQVEVLGETIASDHRPIMAVLQIQ
jgi:endonuclease/exonuclease/phosphatase (EEP) superfamily protein YafD